MQQPIIPSRNYASEAQLTRAMAEQVQDIELAGILARQGLREIRTAHGYATERLSQTLRCVEQVKQTAVQRRGLSPLQQAALYHYTQAYLYEMLLLADESGDAIIAELQHW